VTVAAILFAGSLLVFQQPLNWSKDDASRVATLQKDGARIEGEHAIIWYPPSLSPSEAADLLKRIDPGVAGLWRRVGTHDWQAVPKGKIIYYLSDDVFVSHASGRSAVFISTARVRDGRAPFLHEATHELLASNRRDPSSGGPPTLRPLWLTEGLPDYISRLVAADLGFTESGPFDVPMIAAADALCTERARTPDGATMVPYVGTNQRPEVLFTTDRSRFAPTFYTCSLSFVNYLVGQINLNELVDLFSYAPTDMNGRLQKLGGKTLADLRAAWLRRLQL